MAKRKRVEVTLSAVVIRANGEIEDKGVLGYWKEPKGKRKQTPMADVITYTGFAIVTNTLYQQTLNPKYVGWGTGGATATQAGTALSTETYSTLNNGSNALRTTGSLSQQTQTQTNDTFRITATLTAAANAPTITNVGVFDTNGASGSPTTPPSGGNLYIWSSFTGIALNAGDSVALTLNVKQI